MELTDSNVGSGELLGAQTLLWSHIFSHIDSMSLKCAVELGIPDAIHSHGQPISLPDLLAALSISPTKGPSMRRLMRMLTLSGIFTSIQNSDGEEELYSLSPLSNLLVNKGKVSSLSGFASAMLHPDMVNPLLSLTAWFRGDGKTPFASAHGFGIWEFTDRDPEFNKMFNEAMAIDTHFVMSLLLKDCGHVFDGLTSLVDVGGGTGSAAVAIADAFPNIKCSVLDLPQVVGAIVDKDEKVDFIAGDMFEYIPPANAILLKWILHDWGDENCVKLLKRCKEAIPCKEDGGKVIIIDMVIGSENSLPKSRETQLRVDVLLLALYEGFEREEEQWKKIFMEAGFTDYKITPALGTRSIIELYP